MLNFFKKTEIDYNLYAPVNGEVVKLSEVSDKVFSSGMMGQGVGFKFDGDTVYAPCNGKIILIANTKHAIGIMADNGAEILIHVGLDTVQLNGKGFDVLVSVDSIVKQGEPILKIDRAYMAEKNIDLTIPMVITNSSDLTIKCVMENGRIEVGDKVIEILK
jgi:sugar PTS system EIIA component